MEEHKYNIAYPMANVLGDVVIREGQAEPIYDPVKVDISGTIFAPYQYLAGKITAREKVQHIDGMFIEEDVYDPECCHLEVYSEEGRIVFIGNEKDKFQTRVEGRLEHTAEYDSFDINSVGAMWTRDSMIQLFRRNRHHFKDPQKCIDIIKGLRDYTSQVQKMHKNREENSGNVEKSYEAVVEKLSFDVEFELNIAIFKSTPKETFNVEIAVDASGSALQFYMISDELFEIEEEIAKKQIAGQIDLFQNWGCSIVHIN
jgi:hypothetical protein